MSIFCLRYLHFITVHSAIAGYIGLDLAKPLLGREVPNNSGTLQWKDGRTTVLPAVFRNGINVCDEVDIPIAKYYAEFPSSTPSSENVLHLTYKDLESDNSNSLDSIEAMLRSNKSVVIRGLGHHATNGKFTPEFLDKYFGISPYMAVDSHGALKLLVKFTVSDRSQMLVLVLWTT